MRTFFEAEDETEARRILNVGRYEVVIAEVLDELRAVLKYDKDMLMADGRKVQTAAEAVEWVRKFVFDALREHGIDDVF